jgi:hypothetical protein
MSVQTTQFPDIARTSYYIDAIYQEREFMNTMLQALRIHSCYSAVRSFHSPARSRSVNDCGVHELFEQFAIVRSRWAGRLTHIDSNNLFAGIDPEIGAGVTTPHEFAF